MTGDEILNKIKDSGVDIDVFLAKMKLLEITADIIDTLESDIEDDFKQAKLYKQETKHSLRELSAKAKFFVKRFDNIYANKSTVAQDKYGELSDKILIEALKIIKNDRD